jgi:hypothetical protein
VFVLAIRDLGINLTLQEEATLLRAWNIGEFKVNIEDIYNTLKTAN